VIALTSRSKFTRTISALVALSLILGGFGAVAEAVFGADAQQPFAEFKPDVDLDIEDGEFEIITTFTLGPGNNGLDPASESVTLEVTGGKAAFSVTIPPGSFKKDRSGHLAFQGTVNRVRLLAALRVLRAGVYHFEIEGDRVNLKGVANPVTVRLTIGDDGGSSSVKAKIE
jgi:hypothetical protein